VKSSLPLDGGGKSGGDFRELSSYGVWVYFRNFFLNPTSPIIPEQRRRIVEGSGTDVEF
jgi:hypothetical protein